MPTETIKAIAKKSKKPIKDVEKAWEKSKALAKKSYDPKEDAYWPTVVTILKNMVMGEDGEPTPESPPAPTSGPTTTTADLAYHYKYVGDEKRSYMKGVKKKTKYPKPDITKISTEKELFNRIESVVKAINNPAKENKLFGGYFSYHYDRDDNDAGEMDEIFRRNFDKCLDSVEKHAGIKHSYVNKLV